MSAALARSPWSRVCSVRSTRCAWSWSALARPQRWLSTALAAVIALAGLLAVGRWLQLRLDRETPVVSSTRPPPTSPVLTSQPVVRTTRPPGSPGITRTASTAAQVDSIAVTPGSVWVAAGGLFYTVGIVFYVLDDRLRHSHGVWHLFVLAGSVCHYIAILRYVVRPA